MPHPSFFRLSLMAVPEFWILPWSVEMDLVTWWLTFDWRVWSAGGCWGGSCFARLHCSECWQRMNETGLSCHSSWYRKLVARCDPSIWDERKWVSMVTSVKWELLLLEFRVLPAELLGQFGLSCSNICMNLSAELLFHIRPVWFELFQYLHESVFPLVTPQVRDYAGRGRVSFVWTTYFSFNGSVSTVMLSHLTQSAL